MQPSLVLNFIQAASGGRAPTGYCFFFFLTPGAFASSLDSVPLPPSSPGKVKGKVLLRINSVAVAAAYRGKWIHPTMLIVACRFKDPRARGRKLLTVRNGQKQVRPRLRLFCSNLLFLAPPCRPLSIEGLLRRSIGTVAPGRSFCFFLMADGSYRQLNHYRIIVQPQASALRP